MSAHLELFTLIDFHKATDSGMLLQEFFILGPFLVFIDSDREQKVRERGDMQKRATGGT